MNTYIKVSYQMSERITIIKYANSNLFILWSSLQNALWYDWHESIATGMENLVCAIACHLKAPLLLLSGLVIHLVLLLLNSWCRCLFASPLSQKGGLQLILLFLYWPDFSWRYLFLVTSRVARCIPFFLFSPLLGRFLGRLWRPLALLQSYMLFKLKLELRGILLRIDCTWFVLRLLKLLFELQKFLVDRAARILAATISLMHPQRWSA